MGIKINVSVTLDLGMALRHRVVIQNLGKRLGKRLVLFLGRWEEVLNHTGCLHEQIWHVERLLEALEIRLRGGMAGHHQHTGLEEGYSHFVGLSVDYVVL